MNESGAPVRRLWDRPMVPIAIVLLGLILSLYRIDAQSLWSDEAFSVAASSKSTVEMYDILIEDFVHPPLHYHLLHTWMRLFGAGSLQARLLSAILGALAIAAMYLLGKYLFDRRTALVAASVLAVSQLRIEMSQEARPYELLLLLMVCTIYLLVRALYERSVPLWWAFVLGSAAMLYTHYYAIFAVGLMFLYAFLFRRKYDLPFGRLIGGAVLVAALLMPWLSTGVVDAALHNRKTSPAELGPWHRVHWWTLGTTINRFNNGFYFALETGSRSGSGWWNYLAGALLFCVPAALAFKPIFHRFHVELPDASEQERLLFLAALFLLPLLVVLALGQLNLQYHPRYVMYVLVPYYLFVARGLVSLNSPAMRRSLVALLLLYSIGSLHSVYFTSYKEDYRGALGEVARGYREGDCAAFIPNGIPLQWSIYYGDPSRIRAVTVRQALHEHTTCQRIWAVSYCRVEMLCDLAHRELQGLQPKYTPIASNRYFWVEVRLYGLDSSTSALVR